MRMLDNIYMYIGLPTWDWLGRTSSPKWPILCPVGRKINLPICQILSDFLSAWSSESLDILISGAYGPLQTTVVCSDNIYTTLSQKMPGLSEKVIIELDFSLDDLKIKLD